jgi:hypothetical protein
VIELGCGITVYPAREEQGRWRAVWYENGERQQYEAASEEKMAAKLAHIGTVTCQDITTGHMQKIVNAGPHGQRRQAGPGGDLGRHRYRPARQAAKSEGSAVDRWPAACPRRGRS